MSRVDVVTGPEGGVLGEEQLDDSRRRTVRAVVLFILVAAGHAVGTAIVYQLNHVPSLGVTFFPGAGVTVAALLLAPRRLRPVVLAATYSSELVSHFVLREAVATGVGLALSDTVGPWLGATLVRRWVGGVPHLSRRRDLVAFVIGGAVAGPLLDALTGPPFARLHISHGSYFATMGRWATGDALGVLVVGGLILSWATDGRWPVRPRYPVVEGSALAAAFVALTGLVLWRWSASPTYLTIPLLGWAALRFGVRGATTGAAFVTALAVWATVTGHGQFATAPGQSREVGLWLLQLFVAVALLTALLLASQVSELAEAVSSAEASEEQYRGVFRATSEGLIINELATGRIVEVNRAFCRMHGYTRDELIGASPTVFIHPDDHKLFGDYLDALQHGVDFQTQARDVTKDGRVFDAEVRGSRLLFHGRPHALGVVRDVSQEAAAYRLLEERVADRTRELSRLLAVATRLAGLVDVGEIDNVLNEDAATLVPRSTFAVWRLSQDHLCPTHPDAVAPIPTERLPLTVPALRRGELVRYRGPDVDPELFSELTGAGVAPPDAVGLLGVPLVGGGQLLGALMVTRHAPPRYGPDEVEAARALGSHAAVALANAILFERTQTVAAAEARQRVARDLHDSVSQTLFSLTLHAKAARMAIANAGVGDDDRAARAVEEVIELTRGALAEMRALIFELRPGALAEEGLVAAVTKHAGALSAREGLEVDVVGPSARLPLDATAEEELYRLVQEALYNVVKHAGTTSASVAISVDDGSITVAVADGGVGFDPASPHPGHLGLASMRERVARLGGRLRLDSAPGAGTTVTVTVPTASGTDRGASS